MKGAITTIKARLVRNLVIRHLRICVIILSCLSAAVFGQAVVRVTGRVVDEAGEPIEGALTRLYWKCDSCLDQLFPAVKTDAGGHFEFASQSATTGALLYIDDVVPQNAWAPLAYLPEESRERLPCLRGLKVRVSGTRLNLGEIPIPCRNGVVMVEIVDDVRPSLSDDISSDIRMSILDERNRVVIAGYIPRSAINYESHLFRLALPAAKNGTTWKVSLNIGEMSPSSRQRLTFYVKVSQTDCQRVTWQGTKPLMIPC